MIDFNEFRNKWTGNRIDWDRTYGYQCVDLIRQYFYECFNFPGGGGVPRAIDYWTGPPADVLQKFSKVGNSDARQGDVVMLWGLPGNDDGHIGIATGQGSNTQIEILEQNGSTGTGSGQGGDAIRTRFVDRSRVAGLLRPNPVVVNPITLYEPKPRHTLQTNKQPTNWWNLNNTTTDINTFKPAAVLNIGIPFTVGGVAHHINGHQYAMTPEDFNRAQNGDMSTNNGVNLKDLSPIPEPVQAPYVPPAPPVTAPTVEKYTVIPDVLMYFNSAEDARGRRSARGVISKGEYIVLAKDGHAYKLVKNNQDRDSFWVNTYDNKLEVPKPAPAPIVPTLPVDIVTPVTEPVDVSDNSNPIPNSWKAVQSYLNLDKSPVLYTVDNEVELAIRDLEGKHADITMPPYNDGKPVPIVSWFTGPDGNTYGRPKRVADGFMWYGLPKHLLTPKHSLDFNNDSRVNIEDIYDGIAGFVDYGSRYFRTAIAPLAPKVIQAKTKITKSIDGFRRPK